MLAVFNGKSGNRFKREINNHSIVLEALNFSRDDNQSNDNGNFIN